MIPDYTSTNVSALAARWWIPVIRGAAAIAFGVLAIVEPVVGLFTLVLLWGAYALVDGLFNLMLAAWAGGAGRSWGWLLFSGIVSVVAGVLTFSWPGVTALVLLTVIGVWAVLTGIAEIATAVRIRRQVQGEWLLATGGVLSVLFGVFLVLLPRFGALVLVWMIGGYAVVLGALLVGLGVRLHRWGGVGEPAPA
jgi:uncharacterized membrane protein HdeD (DUF308 family)